MPPKKDVKCFERTNKKGQRYTTCKDKKTGEQLRKKATKTTKSTTEKKASPPKAKSPPKSVAKPKAKSKPKSPPKSEIERITGKTRAEINKMKTSDVVKFLPTELRENIASKMVKYPLKMTSNSFGVDLEPKDYFNESGVRTLIPFFSELKKRGYKERYYGSNWVDAKYYQKYIYETMDITGLDKMELRPGNRSRPGTYKTYSWATKDGDFRYGKLDSPSEKIMEYMEKEWNKMNVNSRSSFNVVNQKLKELGNKTKKWVKQQGYKRIFFKEYKTTENRFDFGTRYFNGARLFYTDKEIKKR